MANEKVEGNYLYYKNKPLVREENTICYGDKNEKCILILEIMSYKEDHGVSVPENVLVQVIDSNDPGKIIRQGQYVGMYDAFSMGLVWLDHALQ